MSSVAAERTASLLGRMVRRLSMLVLLLVAAAPVYLFIRLTEPVIPGRVSVPPPRLDGGVRALAAAAPDYGNAVAVLTYHDIRDEDHRPYDVSPQAFADQMAALKRAGYQTISAARFAAFVLHGAPVPRRALLLTFDDGTHTAWSVADAVLAREGFKATLFVISGQIDHHRPYYLSTAELRDLARSGRWSLEAHTYDGHRNIPVGAQAWDVNPFLTNLEWLAKLKRHETVAEYRRRVVRDLDKNVRALERFGPRPQLFAFPFSAVDAPSNDRRAIVPALMHLVAQRFPISLVDSRGNGRFILPHEPHPQELPRFLVDSHTSASDLLDELAAAAPVPPRLANAVRTRGWRTDGGRVATKHGLVVISPLRKPWAQTLWSPMQAVRWRDYRVQARIAGLGDPLAQAAAVILLRTKAPYGEDDLSIAVGARLVTIRRQFGGTVTPLAEADLRVAGTHEVVATLVGGRLAVAVDGTPVAAVPTGPVRSGGIGVGMWRPDHRGPQPRVVHLTVQPASRIPHDLAGTVRQLPPDFGARLPVRIVRGPSGRSESGVGPLVVASDAGVRRHPLRGVRRLVALTFDDGPGPYTGQVLAVLRRMHATATFFDIGRAARAYPLLLRAERRAGFEIADHTWSHIPLDGVSRRAAALEIRRGAAALEALGAPPVHLFRPPEGSLDSAVVRMAVQQGLQTLVWSIDTRDWSRPSVAVLVRRALAARGGDVILMHDGGGDRSQTADALPAIIRGLRARGLRLVTASQLLAAAGARR